MQSVGSTSFTYDKDGIRVTKTTSNGIISYVYNNGKLLAEIRGGEIIYYFYNATGICGARYKGTDYVYEKNVFGDVIAVIKNGTDVAQYNYDAWGNVDEVYVNDNDDFAPINPIRYRGYYYDTETGLYYLLTRYYDANIGQFINPDTPDYLEPETIDGVNLYAYCRNNPVMYVDPSGHALLAIFLILAAITIAGAVVGGKTAYDEGARGGDLAAKIVLGAAMGLATGGAVVSVGAVIAGAIGGASATFLGVSVAQAFSTGALAFDFVAFVVAPIYGITMQAIEYETPSSPFIPKPQLQPKHPGLKN